MKNLLLDNHYTVDTITKIWSRPQYQGIPYSDGDETENRIRSIIQNCTDVSVMSDELKQYCTDWPTHYYLNKNRVNLLRHYADVLRNADVLEIGAGCGAITRFLGECQANVFALEGSKRRASIARERCRDLANVEVVSENFTEFQLPHQFDVITLIGVLEYANWFTPGENPALEMLKKVKTFLKPSGVLIIAIENQLGLKYFAGAPEDHLGERMVGVEGRYLNNGPQTFGKHVLDQMLKQAGFEATEFSAPLPDYKLPLALITQRGFNEPGFKAKDLMTQLVKKDLQIEPPFAFSQESAWSPLFDNQVALDFSNSFLITASLQTEYLNAFCNSSAQVLAYHYSTNRVSHYCKQTQFVRQSDGTLEVHYYPELFQFRPQALPVIDPAASLEFQPKISASYYSKEYVSFSQLIHSAVKQRNWTYQELAKIVLHYLRALEQITACSELAQNFDKNKTIPAQYFDAIAQNVLWNQAEHKAVLIDEEWVSSFEPSVGYLIFRSFVASFSELTWIAPSAVANPQHLRDVLQGVFYELGTELNDSDVEQFERLEQTIQRQVSGHKSYKRESWYCKNQLKIANVFEQLHQYQTTVGSIQEAHAMRDELYYLRTVKQQFDALLVHNEALFTSRTTLTLGSDNYHERLLRIYNSRLWSLCRRVRSWITKATGK